MISSGSMADARPVLSTEGISRQGVFETEIFILGKKLAALSLSHAFTPCSV